MPNLLLIGKCADREDDPLQGYGTVMCPDHAARWQAGPQVASCTCPPRGPVNVLVAWCVIWRACTRLQQLTVCCSDVACYAPGAQWLSAVHTCHQLEPSPRTGATYTSG